MSIPIVVVCLTYQRTAYAVKTIRAFRQLARYDDLRWYVADDGSAHEHYVSVHQALEGCQISGSHHERIGYGAGANRGIAAARAQRALMFFLEDDWQLLEPLDLNPFAELLQTNPSIGMVRMGYLVAGATGRLFAQQGQLYWRLQRQCQPTTEEDLVFTGHPSLRHARLHDDYGLYAEGLLPGDTELEFAQRVRAAQTGCDIVWPAMFPAQGVFGHIGITRSYT